MGSEAALASSSNPNDTARGKLRTWGKRSLRKGAGSTPVIARTSRPQLRMSSEMLLAWTRDEDAAVAFLDSADRRGLEEDHAAAGSEMRRHGGERRAPKRGIENVLQHRHPQHQIELLAELQSAGIGHGEAAREAFGGRAAPRLGDHGGTQVDAQHLRAAAGQQPAPASDAAPHIEHPRGSAHAQPGIERETLLPVDHAVVELRHTVRANGGQAVAVAREALRAVLPVGERTVVSRSGYAAADHDVSPVGCAESSGRRGSRNGPDRFAAETA